METEEKERERGEKGEIQIKSFFLKKGISFNHIVNLI